MGDHNYNEDGTKIYGIERYADGVPCQCGGYADEVDCTKEEINSDMNCGRSFACCVGAFVCRVCKKRIVASLNAPDIG